MVYALSLNTLALNGAWDTYWPEAEDLERH